MIKGRTRTKQVMFDYFMCHFTQLTRTKYPHLLIKYNQEYMYWYNFVLFLGLVHILPITLCILEDEITLEKNFQTSCLNFSAINDEK